MTTSTQHRDFLGVGEQQPATVDSYGSIALVDDVPLIKQSIARILNTPLGTEYFLRSFGSRIRELQYEQNDAILQNLLEYEVSEAIARWEPRVKYTGIEFFTTKDPGELSCTISYEVVATGTPDSFVYPFYRDGRYS